MATEQHTDVLALTQDVDGDGAASSNSQLAPGTRIGGYRVLRKIGQGGMAAVYLAEQCEPIRRIVAVKVVRMNPLDREARARLELERQALAHLAHPGIAQIFDAGTTADGWSYFAMEYVDGMPLDHWWSNHTCDFLARIALLHDLCRAVGHAHRRGIVHCDLKPANVLVTQIDGKAQLKVIDFGIARATGSLEAAACAGTPAYMSPEQARDGAIVDARSDVYTLAALLREALTGEPLRPWALSAEQRGPAMFQRIAAEPAYRNKLPLSDRRISAARRRELAAILDRALSPDPNQRYEDAHALADELQHWLQMRPVTAMGTRRSYVLACWLRRNRLPTLIAGAFVALTMILGWHWHDQYHQTRIERDSAEQVLGILLETFQSADPVQFPGGSATARDLLAGSAQRILQRPLAPSVKLRVLRALAEVQLNLELYTDARNSVNAALEQIPDFDDETNLALELLLARIDSDDSRFEDAERRASAAAEMSQHRYPALWLDAQLLRAENASLQGRNSEAQALLDELDATVRRDGNANARLRWTIVYGNISSNQGEYERAQAALEQALAQASELWGGDDLRTLNVLNDLAMALQNAEQLPLALGYLRRVEALSEAAWGSDSSGLAIVLGNIGTTLQRMQRADEAVALHQRAVHIFERNLTAPSLHVGTEVNNLASALEAAGSAEQALPHYERALAVLTDVLGPDNQRVGIVLHNMGRALITTGDLPAAAMQLERSQQILAGSLPPEHPRLQVWRITWADLLLQQGDTAAATEILETAVPAVAEAFGAHSAVAQRGYGIQLRALLALQRCAEARALVLEQPQLDGAGSLMQRACPQL